MVVYRAHLPEPAGAILAVQVRPVVRSPQWHLGARLPLNAYRVALRYVAPGGVVKTHRGLLHASTPPDRRLEVVACQSVGADVVLSLAPKALQRRRPSERCLQDRFDLPLSFQAWGIVGFQEARTALRVGAEGQGAALVVRGAVTVLLRTPAALLRLRVPFCRMLAEAEAETLTWAVDGGVSALKVHVAPGGLVEAKVALSFCYTGRPAEPGAAPEEEAISQVREVTGTVTAAKAEPAGEGFVLVQGTAEVDAYWVDQAHRSRWTGKRVPFSSMAALAGVQPEDRLEARGAVERIRLLPGARPAAAALIIAVVVTHIRPVRVRLGDGCYRLEEILGETTVSVEIPVELADRTVHTVPIQGPASREIPLPELGFPDLWRHLSVRLAARSLPGDRWRLQATLDAVPTGAGGGGQAERHSRAVAEGVAGRGMAALASLDRVGPNGGLGRVALVPEGRGERGGGGRPGSPAGVGAVELPGPTRWVLGVEAFGGRKPWIRAVVAGAAGLRVVEGVLATSEAWLDGPPGAMLAYPMAEGGRWWLVVERQQQRI